MNTDSKTIIIGILGLSAIAVAYLLLNRKPPSSSTSSSSSSSMTLAQATQIVGKAEFPDVFNNPGYTVDPTTGNPTAVKDPATGLYYGTYKGR